MHRPALVPLAVLVLWLGAAQGNTAAASDPPKSPNIVLLLADDLGYGDVGAYGARFVRTPAIDSLAQQGVRFTQFFASANVCTPSRAGLLTGRYPVRSRLAGDVIFPEAEYGLGEGEVTLAEILKAAGYDTWIVGKWHLGHTPSAWPTRHGFDYFFGIQYSNDMEGVALFRNQEKIEDPLRQSTIHARLANEAARLIASSGDRPFFLYLPTVAPHYPNVPGKAFRKRSAAGPYGDVVEEMDAGIAKVLEAIEDSGKTRETLVIFTSDNGRAWDGSGGAARGGKAGTWEGGYLVPLVVRWPGVIPPGVTTSGLSMNIDLMPTLAAVAGAGVPADLQMDGRDVSALLLGAAVSPHEALYFFTGDRIAAVRTQRWRYLVRTFMQVWEIDHLDPGYRHPLLYDIETHGSELFNMADSEPEVLKRMQSLLDAGRKELEGIPQHQSVGD
ncbi:MAG: sulfatase-like hydrolase/transferase [Gammaproteobacteria bacterium]|nr:sulfatase-like hydrolase/transferase [Gammaproteobacteria bacterium]